MSTPARDLHEPVPGQIDLVELLAAEPCAQATQHSDIPSSATAAPQK